jgi:glycerophosphoryl diester phosphodiesterase
MPWYKKQPIANRGLYNTTCTPENSYLAFEKAIEHNYAIQLDVQLSKDHQVIVCHDENLQRLTGMDWDIAKTTYSKIKRLTLKNSKEKIPLLKDVLHFVHGKVPILIKIQSSKKDGQFEKCICEMVNSYKGALAIESNNHFTVKWFKQHCAHIARGQIIVHTKRSSFNFIATSMKHLYHNWLNKPDFITIEEKNMPALFHKYYQKQNIPLLTFKKHPQISAHSLT